MFFFFWLSHSLMAFLESTIMLFYEHLMQTEQWKNYVKGWCYGFLSRVCTYGWLFFLYADPLRNFEVIPKSCYPDYANLRAMKAFFKDITPAIELFSDGAVVFLRPPRWGKSILLSVIDAFHDFRKAGMFTYYFKVLPSIYCTSPHNQYISYNNGIYRALSLRILQCQKINILCSVLTLASFSSILRVRKLSFKHSKNSLALNPVDFFRVIKGLFYHQKKETMNWFRWMIYYTKFPKIIAE